MKLTLTTKRCLDYFEAFTRLDGYQRSIEVNGRPQLITEAFDLSAKVKWNVAKNKNRLRPIVEAFQELREAANARLRGMAAAFAPPPGCDLTQREVAFSEHKMKVDSAELAENAKLEEVGRTENEIDGLLKLPVDGIKIRSRDPGIISILDVLMNDFIEGEMDFGDRKTED